MQSQRQQRHPHAIGAAACSGNHSGEPSQVPGSRGGGATQLTAAHQQSGPACLMPAPRRLTQLCPFLPALP